MKTRLHFRYRLWLLGTFLFSLSMIGQAHLGVRIKTDPDGNVIVAGDAFDRTTREDIFTIKYSGTGVALWTNRYGGLANSVDNAAAVAVDKQGNVFVLGVSILGTNRDCVTLAYSAAGVALWTNRYHAPGFYETPPTAGLALDNNGNLFITGYSYNDPAGSTQYTAIAFALSSAGVRLWTNTYPGAGRAVVVGPSGNVLVMGSSLEGSCVTLAYTSAGVPLWTNRCNALPLPMAMAVHTNGNVFVTSATGGSGADCATVAYSGPGGPPWNNRLIGSVIIGDYAVALWVV